MESKRESGGKRMAATGRKHVSLWLTEEEYSAIDAARGGMPRTQFLALHGFAAAKKILSGTQKKA